MFQAVFRCRLTDSSLVEKNKPVFILARVYVYQNSPVKFAAPPIN